ncbi:hypothetical protein [Acerihabitans arboris]|uniref:Uncharacterized protein n=1 Tax=Acerihabitans arboris TaxID=2691583 RepID=A0A845SAH3_9GAMM|nr:hypothetical protein [Acerihabitans arboris]NDL61760.1 hypothetical protein [Acerihabitans arboris]
MAVYHPVWGQDAAVTRDPCGKGDATYIGFMPSGPLVEKIFADAVKDAGAWGNAPRHQPMRQDVGDGGQGKHGRQPVIHFI